MDGYTGESFFPENEDRSKWVPILPISHDNYGSQAQVLTRRMLPLRLAWAWTNWKGQKQILRGKVVIKLGSREKEHDLSYVAFY